MLQKLIFRIKRKIHHLTVKKIDDFIEMQSEIRGGIRLSSNHYRIRNRNKYGESKEADLVKFIDRLEPGSVMWDVGANIGYFSIYAAKRGCKVLAFEPDQMTANIINKNIFLNALSEMVMNIPIALNDETKISSFNMREFLPANAYNTFDRDMNEWGNTFKPEFIQGAMGVRGDDIVLDGDLSAFSNPSFIKIDVDGNEYKVLKGMPNLLRGAKYLCIELGYNHPEFKKVRELLSDSGYKEISNQDYIDKKRDEAGMRNFYFEKIV